jgi:osmotically-inducible protein OsmY
MNRPDSVPHKPDKLIQHEVESVLSYDPVLDSSRIVVSSEAGEVTLAGAVPEHRDRVIAGQDAADVVGVRRVRNEILVGPDGAHVADLRLAEECSREIGAEDSLLGSAISVTASNGWVMLSGTVAHPRQRMSAKLLVSKVPGVLGVTENLSVSAPDAEDGA